MSITDLLGSLVVWAIGIAVGAMSARRSTGWRLKSAPSPVVVALASAHPYREHLAAVGPVAAQAQIDLADAAVKRERARIVAIARAVLAGSHHDFGRTAARAILDGIEGGA